MHYAFLAQQHGLDLRAVDHHGDHDLGLRGGLRGRRGHGGVVLPCPRVGGRTGAIEDDQLMARAAQVGRHARAHDPESDEADSHERQRIPLPD